MPQSDFSIAFRLFGDQISGEPYVFDFSSANSDILRYDLRNFAEFQRVVFEELAGSGRTWGIGKYLEERGTLLRHFPQMIGEGRTYHAGLDIVVPEGFVLRAPVDAKVVMAGKEEGLGNYGGYALLRHENETEPLYSFYGHLDAAHIVDNDQMLRAGEQFGSVGGGEDSGGWFTHAHMQMITERGLREFGCFKGYVRGEEVEGLTGVFPSPCTPTKSVGSW